MGFPGHNPATPGAIAASNLGGDAKVSGISDGSIVIDHPLGFEQLIIVVEMVD